MRNSGQIYPSGAMLKDWDLFTLMFLLCVSHFLLKLYMTSILFTAFELLHEVFYRIEGSEGSIPIA